MAFKKFTPGSRSQSRFPVQIISIGKKGDIGLNAEAVEQIGGGLGIDEFTVDLLWDEETASVGVRRAADDDGFVLGTQQSGTVRICAYAFLNSCGEVVARVKGGRWPAQPIDGGGLAICVLDDPLKVGTGGLCPQTELKS